MALSTRTYPYGTVVDVEVFEVTKVAIEKGKPAKFIGLFCHDGKEAYMCLYDLSRTELLTIRKGEKGTLTFRQGGPTSGYWDYAPKRGQ